MRGLHFGSGVIVGLLLGILLMPRITPVPSAVEPAANAASNPVAQTIAGAGDWYRLVKVVDGDTIVVAKDGENITVRLIGVDTPETVDPRKPVQCFGKAASDEMKKILGTASVRLELDPSQGEFDTYGRTLAYVYAPASSRFEGILVNQYLIGEGFAHEYTYKIPYKYQKEFKAAEEAARAAQKGLWAPDACAPATSAPTASNFTPVKKYDCTKNAYNCSSFASQAEAQYVFDLCGGDANDIHQLDRDRDGRVCESLP